MDWVQDPHTSQEGTDLILSQVAVTSPNTSWRSCILNLSSLSKHTILTKSHINLIHRKEVSFKGSQSYTKQEDQHSKTLPGPKLKLHFLTLATGKLIISEKKLELKWLVLSTPCNTALAHLKRTGLLTNAACEYFSEFAHFHMHVAFDDFLIHPSFCRLSVASRFPLERHIFSYHLMCTGDKNWFQQ